VVRLDGLVRVVQRRPFQLRDRVERGGALFRVVAVVERRTVEGDALLRPVVLDEKSVDCRKELGVFGLELVRAPQEDEGALRVAERGEQLARAPGEFRRRRFLGRDRVELRGVDLGEARFGAGHLREPFELGPGALVGDVLVEQFGDGFERALVVFGLFFLQVGEPLQERSALVGVLARFEAGLDGRHELGEARALLVDRLEHFGRARPVHRVLAVTQQRFELGDGALVLAVVFESAF
jgi:hypothetical protein